MHISSNTPVRHPPADYCPPDSAHWLTLNTGPDAGKKLFYTDYSTTEQVADNTIVFVHGNPESSYTYRHIREALLASGQPMRLVAMDHIGFGLSDQADFEMVDMHHAANLQQLIQHLDLQQVTLVVHDWGGPIGIGAFLESPERVANLLVMNTTIFPMPDDGFTYRNYPFPWLPWCQVPRLIPTALWGGLAAYVVSHAEPQSTARFLIESGKTMLQYAARRIPPGSPEYVWSEAMRPRMNSKSSKRNVLQTAYWGHGYRYHDRRHGEQDNHAFYQSIQAKLPVCWGPQRQNISACGYFGSWDACGKSSVISQWQQALPQMADNTHQFEDIGHFIEEYKGVEMAQSILSMLE